MTGPGHTNPSTPADSGGMPHAAEIGAAVARLRAGGVVAFPTETVYGLGADAWSEAAVRRVYELKGRPARNPLIVHVTGADMARTVTAGWDARADRLARAFWPGPLSLVLPKAPPLPALVTGGGANVAVRCPNHPCALALLFEFGGPLVGPSANLSGRVSPTTAAHVRQAFAPDDVLVLEGGPCAMGIESTVLQLGAEGRSSLVLRPGVLGAAEIARVLGEPVTVSAGGVPSDGAALASPGLLEQHYAPRAEAVLFQEHQWPQVVSAAGARTMAIVSHWNRPLPAPHTLILLSSDAEGYAAMLYAALRQADDTAEFIAIEQPPLGGDEASRAVWDAVMDRLGRATRRL